MLLPTVKQLRYVCAVAEYRHFGKAAESCFVSQSALSTGISELEQNLGISLFERGSKVLITPAGEHLVNEAQQILGQLHQFVEHVEQLKGTFKTELKLGVIPTIAPFLLPKILKSFRKEYPDSKLFIREDQSNNLLNLLTKGELDLLLFALPYDTSGFDVLPLFEDELVLCLPKQHIFNEQKMISLADLKKQDILLLEGGHCLRDQTLKACQLQTNDITIPYQATSLSTLVQMVANNIGITLIPQMAVKANIMHDTDTQARPLSEGNHISRTIALIWRKNSPRASEFSDFGQLINTLYRI